MDKWTIERYAVKNVNWKHEVEYWNFFLDEWVSESEVNDDCVNNHFACSDFIRGNPGEIVEMKVTIEEK